MKAFNYLEPRSVAEACRMLAAAGPTARPLAGGTDLVVQLEIGRVLPDSLVYLGRIPDLLRIEEGHGGLRIGAMASLREIELHPVVRQRYPGLLRGAAEVGSVQIRNLATLAGNLCNASPSADTSPALLAYDAEVEITDADGARRLPVADFWTGPGRTVLNPGELVTAVWMPAPPEGQRTFYRKLAVRKAMDLAMVGICVTVARRNGTAPQVRIALAAVAPVCLRATEAERIVQQGPPGPDRFAAAAEAAVAATSPISDQRASADYRRAMVRVLTRKGLEATLTP